MTRRSSRAIEPVHQYTVCSAYRGPIRGGGHATLRPNGGRSSLASGSGRSGAAAATRCRVVGVRSLVRSPLASIAGGGFRKHRSLSIAGQNERRTATSETAEITTSSSDRLVRQCRRGHGPQLCIIIRICGGRRSRVQGIRS